MDAMKAAADQIIAAKVTARDNGGKAEELLRNGAGEIIVAMPATFGPANAWLYNERGGKLGELCDKLGLEQAACEPIIAEEIELAAKK